jgi:hypothetical protein
VFCAAVVTAALSVAGCPNGETPAPAPQVTPPILFNEADWGDDPFPGKSALEIRRLLAGALHAPVSLSLRGASLQTAVKELSQKSGLAIGVTPPVLSASEGRLIDLDIREMPACDALDWITRLIGAWYAVEGTQTVFITRDRRWVSDDRLRLKHYAVGTFWRNPPTAGRFRFAAEREELVQILGYALRHTTQDRPGARVIVDPTGSRLSAQLPRRGHAKLALILEELKKPREVETAEADPFPAYRADLLRIPVTCDFAVQDARRTADELGRRARVHVGFDYRVIKDERRQFALNEGQATLGRALERFARRAGLGDIVVEPGRRVWILAADQDGAVLRRSGRLPWDRSVVRSHYIKGLVRQYGASRILESIRKTVSPGLWDGDLPVAFYHEPAGRLVVIHEPSGQRGVAAVIDKWRSTQRPEPPANGGSLSEHEPERRIGER